MILVNSSSFHHTCGFFLRISEKLKQLQYLHELLLFVGMYTHTQNKRRNKTNTKENVSDHKLQRHDQGQAGIYKQMQCCL